jgi:hypothetical protein
MDGMGLNNIHILLVERKYVRGSNETTVPAVFDKTSKKC